MNVLVIVYANRLINDKETSLEACRLMALADDIENINHVMSSKRATLDFSYGTMNCSKTSQLLIRAQGFMEHVMGINIDIKSKVRKKN